MTVFGHPVLFDCIEIREAAASLKTPMLWDTARTLSLDNALDRFDIFSTRALLAHSFSVCHLLTFAEVIETDALNG